MCFFGPLHCTQIGKFTVLFIYFWGMFWAFKSRSPKFEWLHFMLFGYIWEIFFPHILYTAVRHKCHSVKGEPGPRIDDTVRHLKGCTRNPLTFFSKSATLCSFDSLERCFPLQFWHRYFSQTLQYKRGQQLSYRDDIVPHPGGCTQGPWSNTFVCFVEMLKRANL